MIARILTSSRFWSAKRRFSSARWRAAKTATATATATTPSKPAPVAAKRRRLRCLVCVARLAAISAVTFALWPSWTADSVWCHSSASASSTGTSKPRAPRSYSPHSTAVASSRRRRCSSTRWLRIQPPNFGHAEIMISCARSTCGSPSTSSSTVSKRSPTIVCSTRSKSAVSSCRYHRGTQSESYGSGTSCHSRRLGLASSEEADRRRHRALGSQHRSSSSLAFYGAPGTDGLRRMRN